MANEVLIGEKSQFPKTTRSGARVTQTQAPFD